MNGLTQLQCVQVGYLAVSASKERLIKSAHFEHGPTSANLEARQHEP